MALTKVSTGVVDMSGNTGGLVIAKGTDAQRPTCDASILGSIRENTDENKVEVCTSTGWQFLEEAGSTVAPLIVDYLVVAGGGAGQGVRGGGGGAGGLLTTTSYGGSGTALNLVSGAEYTATIGTGGYGVQDSGNYGQDGSDSYFDSISANGGGGGGRSTLTGRPGGSGGGGGNGGSSYSNQGGAATPAGQGSPGGRSPSFSDAGGGGGANGPNPAGSFNLGATGLSSNITENSVTYATGGRGGYGSQGTSTGISGAANTGDGGSGMFDGYLTSGRTAGSGGSGVVILRYPSAYAITFQTGVGFISSTATLSATSEKVTTITAGSGTITFASI